METIGSSYRLEDYLEEESHLSMPSNLVARRYGLSPWDFPESLELQSILIFASVFALTPTILCSCEAKSEKAHKRLECDFVTRQPVSSKIAGPCKKEVKIWIGHHTFKIMFEALKTDFVLDSQSHHQPFRWREMSSEIFMAGMM